MTTLSDLRSKIYLLLQDPDGDFYSDAAVDSAVRCALVDYNVALPYQTSAEVLLSSSGYEVDLSALVQLQSVEEVSWPWPQPGYANQVQGWLLLHPGVAPTLRLRTLAHAMPQAGQRLRLLYTRPHSLLGLDEAQLTTIPAEHSDLLARGAAGYALLLGAAERSEILERQVCLRLGEALLEAFRTVLQQSSQNAQRCAPTWLAWPPMDKWAS